MKIRTGLQLGSFFPIAVALMVLMNVSAVWFFAPHEAGPLQLVLTVSMVIAVLALIMAAILYRSSNNMMNRISVIESAAARVRSGDLQSLTRPDGEDEIAEVTDTFNEMVGELRGYVQLITAHDVTRRQLADASAALERLRTTQIDVSDRLERLRRAETVVVADAARGVHGALLLRFCAVCVEKLAALRAELQSNRTAKPALAQIDDLVRHVQQLAVMCEPIGQAAEDIDLRELVDDAVFLARLSWSARVPPAGDRVNVRNDIPADATVKAARTDLLRLLSAVIANAGEAMTEGGVVRVWRDTTTQGNLLLSVGDFGVGMSPSIHSRCFRPFFSTRPNAAGLGLAAVNLIAEHHGWKIGIASEAGHGATFCIELPPAPSPQSDRAMPAVTETSRPLRILVVEDDDAVRAQLVSALAGLHHRVTSAADGLAALQAFAPDRFDLVIADRAMPGMAGDELAAKLKDLSPTMPVIMISGAADAILPQEPDNVDALIGKPFSMDQVLRAIKQAMQSAARHPKV